MECLGVNVVVLGMARSGIALAEFLKSRGARVRAVDEKPLEELPEAARVVRRYNIPFCRQGPGAFDRAACVVVSPGVPPDLDLLEDARRNGVEVIGEVEFASRFLEGNTIGITGSNGKTTTTALVGHLLRESGIPVQVGGNIGTPVTALLASSRPGQWNVLELSSFQLETVHQFRAHIAVALNVTPDHLDRHRTFAAYAAAKARLFETQTAEDFAVLSADDPSCLAYASLTRARPLRFSLTRPVTPGAWLEGNRLLLDGEPFLSTCDIPLRGRHNIENVLAAAVVARLAGVSLASIAAAVPTFPGVEHRLEFVRRVRGVDYYNDSKATNVDAALKAIDSFAGPLWIVLGGKDKGSDYAPLGPPLQAKAKAALLIGAAAPKIAAAIGESVPLVECGSIDRAVEAAYRRAAAGDTVLLAPACASFDQFENFEHRGRVFKELVARLEGD